MHQGVCNLSIIPVRAEPSSKSELVSQLLFGETYHFLEQEGDWIKIETYSENYSGWLSLGQFCEWSDRPIQLNTLNRFPYTIATHIENKKEYYLLPGSILHKFEAVDSGACFYINQNKFFAPIGSKDITILSVPEIENYAIQFLNSPYMWGGKSMWGIDCSGFTQLLYKLMGIQLPRDAWQQAEGGELLTFINEAKLGDLAFFENEDGKITHVGFMLGPGDILHASGKVRRDILDSYGIYNSTLCKHTHKLRLMKRFLG